MLQSYSSILGIELSAFGRLFNTKAVLSFKKEYEREEDKKAPDHSAEISGRGKGEGIVEEARYEMVEDGSEKAQKYQKSFTGNHSIHRSIPELTDNKYLNCYLRMQTTSYPIRGLNLDQSV